MTDNKIIVSEVNLGLLYNGSSNHAATEIHVIFCNLLYNLQFLILWKLA